MNILIVDDSAMMRQIIRKVIMDHRPGNAVQLYEASDGEQALKTFRSQAIGLVFLDWNMPVVDGYQFVRTVRSEGYETPIVMVTAVTDEDKIYQAAKAGVTSYIEKPVRAAELWEKIEEYMQ